MARIPTPIPRSLVSIVRSVFQGSLGIVLWRLLLLGGGALLLAALASASLGFFAGVLVTLAIWTAWSDNVGRILSDLWNARFLTVSV